MKYYEKTTLPVLDNTDCDSIGVMEVEGTGETVNRLIVFLTLAGNCFACYKIFPKGTLSDYGSHWKGELDVDNLVLYRSNYDKTKDRVPFMTELDAAGTAYMVWNWLENSERPESPDTDGSTNKAFRIKSNWEKCVISPDWTVYGK